MTAYLASKEVRLQNYIKLIVHDGIGFDMDSFEPEDGLKNIRERKKLMVDTIQQHYCARPVNDNYSSNAPER